MDEYYMYVIREREREKKKLVIVIIGSLSIFCVAYYH